MIGKESVTINIVHDRIKVGYFRRLIDKLRGVFVKKGVQIIDCSVVLVPRKPPWSRK